MVSDKHVLSAFQGRSHDHGECIDAALASAEAVCTRQGLRLTPLRRRVLELVWSCHAPIKAYDVLQQLQRERPRAAPPTVYRALEFLLNAGLVHRIESLNAYVGCGGVDEPHAGQFLICCQCGAVAEIDDPKIARALSRTAAELDFKVARQTIEIEGLCPLCG